MSFALLPQRTTEKSHLLGSNSSPSLTSQRGGRNSEYLPKSPDGALPTPRESSEIAALELYRQRGAKAVLSSALSSLLSLQIGTLVSVSFALWAWRHNAERHSYGNVSAAGSSSAPAPLALWVVFCPLLTAHVVSLGCHALSLEHLRRYLFVSPVNLHLMGRKAQHTFARNRREKFPFALLWIRTSAQVGSLCLACLVSELLLWAHFHGRRDGGDNENEFKIPTTTRKGLQSSQPLEGKQLDDVIVTSGGGGGSSGGSSSGGGGLSYPPPPPPTSGRGVLGMSSSSSGVATVGMTVALFPLALLFFLNFAHGIFCKGGSSLRSLCSFLLCLQLCLLGVTVDHHDGDEYEQEHAGDKVVGSKGALLSWFAVFAPAWLLMGTLAALLGFHLVLYHRHRHCRRRHLRVPLVQPGSPTWSSPSSPTWSPWSAQAAAGSEGGDESTDEDETGSQMSVVGCCWPCRFFTAALEQGARTTKVLGHHQAVVAWGHLLGILLIGNFLRLVCRELDIHESNQQARANGGGNAGDPRPLPLSTGLQRQQQPPQGDAWCLTLLGGLLLIAIGIYSAAARTCLEELVDFVGEETPLPLRQDPDTNDWLAPGELELRGAPLLGPHPFPPIHPSYTAREATERVTAHQQLRELRGIDQDHLPPRQSSTSLAGSSRGDSESRGNSNSSLSSLVQNASSLASASTSAIVLPPYVYSSEPTSSSSVTHLSTAPSPSSSSSSSSSAGEAAAAAAALPPPSSCQRRTAEARL